LIFIDALRVSAVAFVIVHHAAQAYGPTGGFWPVHDQAQSAWFLPFYYANAAFGMGLLFLVAGYFTDASYERKGAQRFLTERWVRIGVPLVTLILLVQLPAVYLIGSPPSPGAFIRYVYEHGWQPIYLHLWFLGHLLLYAAAFVTWREVIVPSARASKWSAPGHGTIALFVLALALITWIIRLRYPIDKWVPLLWIMPAEPAHLAQYVALFAAGIAAHRGDWFRKMPTTTGMLWLGVGLLAYGGIYLVYAIGLWHELIAIGGFSWPSLLCSLWETVIAAGLSIGLIVAFREMFFRPSHLLGIMAAASFGAYILHPWIVVALQAAIAGLTLPAFAKFAIVSVFGTALAFSLAHLAGKVPGLRTVLGGIQSGNETPFLSKA
jgi:surface polysaccharide O-acyltransferase-like enzyme